MVWYSHLFQNFPQFIVIYTVKGFGIVNKAEIDVLLELFCFFDDPADIGNLISGSSAFSKTSLNIWKFRVHVLLKNRREKHKKGLSHKKQESPGLEATPFLWHLQAMGSVWVGGIISCPMKLLIKTQ